MSQADLRELAVRARIVVADAFGTLYELHVDGVYATSTFKWVT